MVYQWPLTKRGHIVNLLDLSIYFKTFYDSNTYYPASQSIRPFIMHHYFQNWKGGGISPSWHLIRGREQPGQIASSSQGHPKYEVAKYLDEIPNLNQEPPNGFYPNITV